MSIPTPQRDAVQEAVEEGPSRYAAFAMRLRTLITASSRYIAYSSDIGEAFRPLTNPNFVRAAYGISWTYILGDVGYAGYRANQEYLQIEEKGIEALSPAQKVELKKRQHEAEQQGLAPLKLGDVGQSTHVGLIMARRAVFQSIASMALPAFTIHSIVRYSAPLFAKAKSQRLRGAGPTVAGLAFVPALPYLFDEPVEHVIDTAFDWIEDRMPKKSKGSSDKEKKEIIGARKKEEDLKAKTSPQELISRAAIVGIGVDMLYLPRLRQLLARHAARLKRATSSTSPAAVTIEQTAQTISGAGAIASSRLARRILHDDELKELTARSSILPAKEKNGTPLDEEAQLRFLAVRWTAKEAAFKALYPHYATRETVSWHDAIVTGRPKPRLVYSERLKEAFARQDLNSEGEKEARAILPTLHLSVSHDGDYVVSYVVAEESSDHRDVD